MKTILLPDGEQTWFLVTDLEADLQQAAERLGYKPTPHGGFGRPFPSDTPYLEESYHNFARSVETLILQKAGRVAVPWEAALEAFLSRVASLPIQWWLTGSASLAARGVPIEPGDIDIVTRTVEDGIQLDRIFQDVITEPARPGWIAERVTRTFLGARVGWVAGVHPEHGEQAGLLEAARSVEPFQWRGYQILLPSPELQLRVNERRGRTERVHYIREWLAASKVATR
ncbi:hypothetical protein KSC_043370 [Ktedonobacter sp. SOSP1-52]|uniref:hypothetical protein n=1 Tax=Ktedonobacter sp. SOSP1-52 TaxID=2778366 RepID=UPI00191529FB|nr:hypothetical protein [Ktedonobacter sp. SOSP1-52]GHO65445.1 hypothetical protein KSC_043370 [Ktedonobacter sp. SOSP1-52]